MGANIKVRHLFQAGATGFVLGATVSTRVGRSALRSIGRDLIRGTRLALRGGRFAAPRGSRAFGAAGRFSLGLARAPFVVSGAAVVGIGAAAIGITAGITAPRGTGTAGRVDIAAGTFTRRFVVGITGGRFSPLKRLGSEQEVITKFGTGRKQIASFFSFGFTRKVRERR